MFTLFGVMTNVLKIVLCITLPILPMPYTVDKSLIEVNYLNLNFQRSFMVIFLKKTNDTLKIKKNKEG